MVGRERGSEAAYQDLFHLNPSNSDANNAKSNNPIGIVGGNPAFDNGLVLIGAPAAGYGGGASKVFEPADEYKGDFARAYLYIMTAYDAISSENGQGWRGSLYDNRRHDRPSALGCLHASEMGGGRPCR